MKKPLSFDTKRNYTSRVSFKLISIRNKRNSNRNQFWHYTKQNICFGCFVSIPKQRVSVFRLNRNKQKSNQNSVIESILWYFFTKFRVVSVCSVCFETVLFVSVVSTQVRNTKTNRNKPKFFVFGFTKQTEIDLVSVCFGSNQNLFLFVSRTPYIRVPSQVHSNRVWVRWPEQSRMATGQPQVPFIRFLRPLILSYLGLGHPPRAGQGPSIVYWPQGPTKRVHPLLYDTSQ